MTSDPTPGLHLPDPARLIRRSVAIAERAGMTRPEAQQAVFIVARTVADIVSHWLYDDCLTMADVSSWLDQLAAEVPIPGSEPISE